jgi:hypothetical protein
VPSALGPEVFGVTRDDMPPRHEYLARSLARICDAALRHRDCGRGLLVNYDQLPGFASGPLVRHFGMTLSPADLERMSSASAADAKTPQLIFSDDRQQKRRAITPALKCLVDQWLSPLFESLKDG